MKDKRTKTTIQQVLKDIAPYTTKTLLGKMSIKEESIKPVAILLLNQYSNVKLSQGVSSKREGCPWMKISVKGILLIEEKTLDIIVSNKTKKLGSVRWKKLHLMKWLFFSQRWRMIESLDYYDLGKENY